MEAPIIAVGDPVLRAVADAVDPATIASGEIQELIAMMRHTMATAPGVGLAAPQIGRSLQIFVMADPKELTVNSSPAWLAELERTPLDLVVAINPTITPISDEQVDAYEGCLSVKKLRARVRRWRTVRLDATDAAGTAFSLDLTGWSARIAQHEVDHLEGRLYVDRMDPRTLTTDANYPRHHHAVGGSR